MPMLPEQPSPGVLRIITRLNIGGPAQQAILMTEDLSLRGFRTHLVHGTTGDREGTYDVDDRISLTHVPALRRDINPLDDAKAYRAIRELMGLHRPTVVHTHMAKAGALGRTAARRAKVPVIVHTFHGHVIEGYFGDPSSRAILLAERGLARISDALIGVSNAVRDELMDLGVGRRDQWHVIPLGLDLSGFERARPDVGECRRILELPVDKPVVAIVGRLAPIKDHQTFLRAAASVATRNPDVHFAIAGDGPLRLRLELDAMRMLGDRVHFLGWVGSLPGMYAAFDVVVLTSRNEGTPVALIEAGAAGKPVVATRVGGVRDVVYEGENGLLAPPADPAAVAAAIETILQAPALAKALGKQGRERSKGFSRERLADDLARLYREVMERKIG
jgi:glycosyltransferase involved in cell wall biosynthesis